MYFQLITLKFRIKVPNYFFFKGNFVVRCGVSVTELSILCRNVKRKIV